MNKLRKPWILIFTLIFLIFSAILGASVYLSKSDQEPTSLDQSNFVSRARELKVDISTSARDLTDFKWTIAYIIRPYASKGDAILLTELQHITISHTETLVKVLRLEQMENRDDQHILVFFDGAKPTGFMRIPIQDMNFELDAPITTLIPSTRIEVAARNGELILKTTH